MKSDIHETFNVCLNWSPESIIIVHGQKTNYYISAK